MGKNERVFKKEYAAELLRIAEADYHSAEILAKDPSGRKENALFHAEQAAEKALKAVLCFSGSPVPMTHELNVILTKFTDSDLPPGGDALHDLTPYATIRRYQEGTFELTAEDMAVALTAVKDVLEWAKRKLK